MMVKGLIDDDAELVQMYKLAEKLTLKLKMIQLKMNISQDISLCKVIIDNINYLYLVEKKQ